YLLDEQLELVPEGGIGEIYLGGDGLSYGYLNRSELTALKFVPNPFSDRDGDRLYRTGDLGKILPEGVFEFVGRIDRQVKVGGFRVELDEIESVLKQFPGVDDAAAVVRELSPGEKRIVAYITTSKNVPLRQVELRSFLKQKLPKYFLPAAIVYLENFPLSPNGKIDLKALPAPSFLRPDLETEYLAPRNEIETLIADIWKDLLGIDEIGVNDNFFELGAHSLQATQAVNRICRLLPVEISLRDFLDSPTIAGLEVIIEAAKNASITSPTLMAPKADHSGRHPPAVCER